MIRFPVRSLSFAAALLMSAGAQAITLTVDNAGSCNDVTGMPAYCTIQAAINAASPGDTISVGAGTYNQDVVVSKQLTLQGAGIGSTIVSGPAGGGSATFQFTAAGIILDGFTVTRDGNAVATWNAGLNTAGIAIQTVGGAEIRNSELTGNRTAIDVNNSSGNFIHNNVIDFNRTGLLFRNRTDNTIVTENFITNSWTMGVLFLDASGGTNVPLQQALGSSFTNNDLSGNWYAGVVDRQAGGALPAPGTTNLKDFTGNWWGTTTIVVTTANSTEPGYAAQIPVEYGGTATDPGGQPDIAGAGSANIIYEPFLRNGRDSNIETTPGRGTIGFQGARTPGSKDDCKNGGWMNAVDAEGNAFSNQGDCVRYFRGND